MEIGGTSVLVVRSILSGFRSGSRIREIAGQVEMLGIRSLSIGSLTGIFTGLVLAIQFAFFLSRFGLQHTVSKVVVITLFRELGPVLTALTVGARIGSGITAELGAMKVTEQIDAVRTLGADPNQKLVFPRLLACVLVLPALTVLADLVGLIAGGVVVWLQYGLPMREYFGGAAEIATVWDFGSGLVKSAVFGALIGAIGCYQGLQVSGGTEGVGTATTRTVAKSAIAICLSDFLLTTLFLSFQ
jgi:phospholipid/cholesterol/gamma-HCH transport system permease protein